MSRPRFIALLLAVLLIGGHTAGLQLVAWTGMLTVRTQTMSWSAAVSSTFDGSTPCRMCRVVSALKSADAPQTTVVAVVKPDFVPAIRITWILPATRFSALPASDPALLDTHWTGDVPTPPPQGC